MPTVIKDFRVGKQTRRGRPEPTDPLAVTVVHRDEADDFLGTTPATRAEHLRGLRDLGLLVHDKRRLTKRVRTGGTRNGRPTKVRAYVFRCLPEEVPRRRARRPRQRVGTW